MSASLGPALATISSMATSLPPSAEAASRSIATWLGGLFVLLLVLISVGGFVRLTGSGLSIPDWPIIHIGDSWSLLPPMSDSGWQAVRERFDADQDHLQARAAAGAIGLGSLGVDPGSMAEFKRMFLIEWAHRFVAGLLGLVALGCLTVALRHRTLRRRLAPPLGGIVALIIFQAILGGLLVKSGTSTHWLFLHLGTAALILSCIVWSLLRATAEGAPTVPAAELAGRGKLRRLTLVTTVTVWVQIVLGALVAGSRTTGNMGHGAENLSTTWPQMYGHFVPPDLWVAANSVSWNLLDNPVLHQWIHRWFAAIVLLHLVLVFWRARHATLGVRTRLGLQVTATFMGIQIMLGLANVFLGAPLLVALGHLVMANLILASLVMTLHDLRFEPAESPQAVTVPQTNLVTAC